MSKIDGVAGVVPALGLAGVELVEAPIDSGLVEWIGQNAGDVVGSRQGPPVDRVQASSDPTEIGLDFSSDPTEIGLDFSGLGIVRRDAAGVIQPVEELGEEPQLVAV